jgi:acyl-CoA reductase-like NAD-dependent aldehyde dehydrogenase
VSSSSKARLLELVSDAISAGASTLSGGGGTQPAEGASFIPSILQGANKQTRLWREETFGPVAAIQVVTTVEEAVEAANDTEYGLSAAVFTEDLRKGLSVAKQLEAG